MRYQIAVNSRDRITGNSNDFTYQLGRVLQNVNSFSLDFISIPIAYYRVNSTNNRFDVGASQVTLTEGDYTITTLATEVQTQLQAINANYTCSVSGNYLVLAHTTTAFTLDFNVDNSAYEVMGFVKTGSYTGTTSYTSPNSVNLYGSQVCHLCSKELGIQSLNDAFDNVVQSFVIDATYGNVNTYINNTPVTKVITTKNLDKIDFSLRKDDGTLFDLDGLNIVFNLNLYTE